MQVAPEPNNMNQMGQMNQTVVVVDSTGCQKIPTPNLNPTDTANPQILTIVHKQQFDKNGMSVCLFRATFVWPAL